MTAQQTVRDVAPAPTSAADAVTSLRAHVTGDLMDIVVDLDAGSGCRLRDQRDGTEYLDMTMFFSSAPLGHGHPGLRTPEFEAALVRAGRIKPSNPDFATVEQARFAETLLATHADLAARKLTPDAPNNKNEERHRLHEKMEREGSASADITLRTSIRMSDEAFAAALEKAKADGRDAVHVRAWLALPAACPSQSHITLDRFTETPAHIAAEDAPQRTVCWEADLTENRTFGAEYSYRETAVYADPLSFTPDPEQPDFYTGEEAPHIVFTPYLRALAAQLTEGITSPAEKAKRIYDYVTLNVRYHFQPSYFVHESIAENCARSRRGDCGIMALTFITLCRIAGIPARWESGFAVAPGDAGCHDWARFYVAPRGWMYADCSYGASMARRGDEVLRRHYFGSLDTGRMVANSAFEAPFDPPMLGFRSDPYDNQSGEMEADGVGLYGDDTVTTKEVLKFEEVE